MADTELNKDSLNSINSTTATDHLTQNSQFTQNKVLRELGLSKVTKIPTEIVGNSKIPDFPFSLFPKKLQRQPTLQLLKDIPLFNKLVDCASRDFVFLKEQLRSTIAADDFIKKLFSLYTSCFEQDLMRGHPSVSINRPDFFFDKNLQRYLLVEINTISCGYSAVSAEIFKYHLQLLHQNFDVSNMEIVNNTNGFKTFDVLAKAVEALKGNFRLKLVLLVIKESEQKGIIDHDLLEEQLSKKYKIKFIKLTLGQIYDQCSIDKNETLLLNGTEIDFVYYRAGYGPEDYPTEKEWKAREMVEKSKTLKCPNIGYQLVGTKRIQKAFGQKGVLDKFLSPSEVKRLQNYFVEMIDFEGFCY